MLGSSSINAWRFADPDTTPEDATLVFRVLEALRVSIEPNEGDPETDGFDWVPKADGKGGVIHIAKRLTVTKLEAQWIVKITKTAGTIPPNWCYARARAYIAAEAAGRSTQPFDDLMMSRMWDTSGNLAFQEYVQAHEGEEFLERGLGVDSLRDRAAPLPAQAATSWSELREAMTRRGRGEGSIFKRSDGRWAASISLGQGRRDSFYGKTREEVRRRLVEALHATEHGTLTTGKATQTVAAFLTEWLEGLQVRPGTAIAYWRNVQRYIIPAIGKVRLQRLRPEQVDAMLREKAKTLSPQSVQHVRAVLRTALNRAVRRGILLRNAAALADAPHVEQYEATFLTVAKARAFLAAANGERLEALYTVALSLGLRQGEALALRWDDLDGSTITVSKSLQRIPGHGLQLMEPKTKRSRRAPSMPEGVVRALRAHRVRQHEERIAAGTDWEDRGLVFCTMLGRPLSATHVVNGSFRRIARKAGAPAGLRFHDLRHSSASLLLAQGVPARTVMEVLGHSTLAMTTRYQHVASELMVEAAHAMDSALGS